MEENNLPPGDLVLSLLNRLMDNIGVKADVGSVSDFSYPEVGVYLLNGIGDVGVITIESPFYFKNQIFSRSRIRNAINRILEEKDNVAEKAIFIGYGQYEHRIIASSIITYVDNKPVYIGLILLVRKRALKTYPITAEHVVVTNHNGLLDNTLIGFHTSTITVYSSEEVYVTPPESGVSPVALRTVNMRRVIRDGFNGKRINKNVVVTVDKLGNMYTNVDAPTSIVDFDDSEYGDL